ncbi:cupin domain-containing protein [Candidatus Phyllobacterium onerii]|uniref:cupin domain-containing protein n=1 Tax=Candidatus Phyllobacterium onerii TaxID=3020828 RepID=UPI00232E3664|nr:cupin domain-containing protein [Phyllobacterium sp. IY22]
MKWTLCAALFVCALVGNAAAAEAPATLPDYSKTPEELSAVKATGGPGGSGNAKVEVVTILGDPSKPGQYAQLLKVQAHAEIPSHHHAGDRVGTVLSGTWHFGYGPKFDKSKLRILPTGSVYTEPSDSPHFAMTADKPVTVLITGNGPTDTIYEDPKDEPTAMK